MRRKLNPWWWVGLVALTCSIVASAFFVLVGTNNHRGPVLALLFIIEVFYALNLWRMASARIEPPA